MCCFLPLWASYRPGLSSNFLVIGHLNGISTGVNRTHRCIYNSPAIPITAKLWPFNSERSQHSHSYKSFSRAVFNIWGKGGDGERPRRMSRDNRGFVFYLLALFLNSELIHSGLSLVVFLYKVLFGQIRCRRCRIQSKFIFRSHDDPKCAQLLQTKFRANLNTDA